MDTRTGNTELIVSHEYTVSCVCLRKWGMGKSDQHLWSAVLGDNAGSAFLFSERQTAQEHRHHTRDAKEFSIHAATTLWRCMVIPYEEEDGVIREYVAICGGSSLVKVCEIGGEERDWTLVGHDGAVTCVELDAREVDCSSPDIDPEHRETEVNTVLYSGSMDHTAVRWNLSDIFAHKPMGGTVSEDFKQMVYMNAELKNIIIIPWSWGFGLTQLMQKALDETAHTLKVVTFFTNRGLSWLVPYCIFGSIAVVAIMLLATDAFERLSAKRLSVLSDEDVSVNPQKGREARSYDKWLSIIQRTLLVVSQFLWLYTFQTLMVPFDCVSVAQLKARGAQFANVSSRAHFVLEADPSVPCFQGWHLRCMLPCALITLAFVWLTAPLQIVMGQTKRMIATPQRFRPSAWCTPPRLVWPRYEALFARTHSYWYFQVAMLCGQISFPCIKMFNTYDRGRRCMQMFVMSGVLLVTSANKPPFMSLKMCSLLFFLCSCLMLSIVVRYVAGHESQSLSQVLCYIWDGLFGWLYVEELHMMIKNITNTTNHTFS